MATFVKQGIHLNFGSQGDEPNSLFDLLSVTHSFEQHEYFKIVQNDLGHMLEQRLNV